jgi:hypothetical protein
MHVWCAGVKECVVSGGFASLESTGGAIVEMSQSLMYEMDIVPGSTALVRDTVSKVVLVLLI